MQIREAIIIVLIYQMIFLISLSFQTKWVIYNQEQSPSQKTKVVEPLINHRMENQRRKLNLVVKNNTRKENRRKTKPKKR